MDDTLRKLQLTQLEILKVFDAFCKENNLKYSLFYGTLLGAIRHKGFIPWDDDLDVCMPRDDYNKFNELWNKSNKTKNYALVNKDNSPLFTQTFTKIRKNSTTFIEIESEIGCYHHGIFIDVFPVDRVPKNSIGKKVYQWNALRYLLLTREYIDSKSNFVIKLISSVILKSVATSKRQAARSKLLGKLTKHNRNQECENVIAATLIDTRIFYDAMLFDKLTEIEFEGSKFMSISEWDKCLTLMYGDYMQLPPEEKRVYTHHPVVIDFEHSYEELNLNGKG